MTPALPTVADVWMARARLTGRLAPTPLRHSPSLSSALGGDIRLKLESINPTHSFKIRGALNAVAAAVERRPDHEPTFVTASAGNHGLAVATAARALGVNAVVFVPASAPTTKTTAIASKGATLDQSGSDYDAAELLAIAYARERHLPFVSPYNHRDVIAGAGTIGLEIVEAWPRVDTVVVPVGGGGLASGVGLALGAVAPDARLIGVEVEASTPFTVSLPRGAVTRIEPRTTLADGLAGNLEPDTITFPLVQQVVHDVVTVSETELIGAIRRLARDEHLIVEGSAAVALAAVLSGHVDVGGKSVAVVLTGANIDVATLAQILDDAEGHG
jgi:threonine dehydratase